ncbi:hypothetical protein GCM10010277_80290 [Streptomyces longisporoflavus]|nr:hypothetical protein GCM10010277_80290 [Streptomyces longisporoflavus]
MPTAMSSPTPPANNCWLNRFEAQFSALRSFAIDGTDHADHGSMLRRYIVGRYHHADGRRPGSVVDKGNAT